MIDAKKPEQALPPAKPLAAEDFLQLFKKSKRVLALAGRPIDGDSLASALAFSRIGASLGVTVDVACGDPIPEQLRFFPDLQRVIFSPDFLRYELIVIFD